MPKVWVAVHAKSGKRDRYHTDRDCDRLDNSLNPQEKELAAVESHRSECKACQGYERYKSENTMETVEMLLETDAEEV